MADPIIQITSQLEASASGAKRFFTGTPCAKGHLSERYVAGGRCVECRLVKNAKERESLSDYHAEYRKRYQAANREFYRAYQARMRIESPERARRAALKWRLENKKKIHIADNNYQKQRYQSDPAYRCMKIMRSRFSIALRQAKLGVSGSLRKTLGYDAAELVAHIEKQFLKGMTWDNQGEWHVDHIIPVSRYFAEGVSDYAIINRLSNLRPLWAKDNLAKGSQLQTLL